MTTRIYSMRGSSRPAMWIRNGVTRTFSTSTPPLVPNETCRLRLDQVSSAYRGTIFGVLVADTHARHLRNMAYADHRSARLPLDANYARNLAAFRELAPLLSDLKKAHTSRRKSTVRNVLRDISSELEPYSRVVQDRILGVTKYIGEDVGEFDALYLTRCDCGHLEVADDTTSLHNGDEYCSECSEDLVFIDDEYYDRDTVYFWDSDGEYHTGPEPEPEEEDDTVHEWAEDCGKWVKHDTSFTPSSFGDFTLGVELEVEAKSNYASAVEHTADALNDRDAYCVLKKDGSLSDNGFEIVTSAQRMQVHLDKFAKWEPYRTLTAWATGGCGVHVHIDSRAFTALTLGKFLMFINDYRNVALIQAIAGRHPSTDDKASRYCAALGALVLENPAKALKNGDSSRYRMVNLCNLTRNESDRLGVDYNRDSKGHYSTVELRIFRASLKKERLLAQIEFAHAAVLFCRVSSWHQLDGHAFKAWLRLNAGTYKNLARWFGINVPKANKLSTAKAPVAVPSEA